MKKIVLSIMIIIVVMIVGFSIGVQGATSSDAIDFSAMDMNGKRITLSDYKDKVIILDFWATWCPPCRAEIPNLKSIKEKFRNKKFEIISIAGFERNNSGIVNFIRDNQMDWIHIIDKTTAFEIAQKYNVTLIPTVYVIKNGKIIASELRGKELENSITRLLN